MTKYAFTELATSTSAYSIKTVNEWGTKYYYLCKADVADDEVTENYLVLFNENPYGGAIVRVRSFEELSEEIVVTGKLTSTICGVSFPNELKITLKNPVANIEWDNANVIDSGKDFTVNLTTTDPVEVYAADQKGQRCMVSFYDIQVEESGFYVGNNYIYDEWGQSIITFNDDGSFGIENKPYQDITVTCKMYIQIDNKMDTRNLTINISGTNN